MVRLPGQVRPLFIDWLERNIPDRASKVISRIRQVRDGNLSDPRFGSRMRGNGQLAEMVEEFFDISRRRHEFAESLSRPLSTRHFRRAAKNQLELGF